MSQLSNVGAHPGSRVGSAGSEYERDKKMHQYYQDAAPNGLGVFFLAGGCKQQAKYAFLRICVFCWNVSHEADGIEKQQNTSHCLSLIWGGTQGQTCLLHKGLQVLVFLFHTDLPLGASLPVNCYLLFGDKSHKATFRGGKKTKKPVANRDITWSRAHLQLRAAGQLGTREGPRNGC